MAHDVQKAIAGALLCGAGILAGDPLAIASGVGVNLVSEGLARLWDQSRGFDSGSPLGRAARHAIKQALQQVEEAYKRETGSADRQAFRDLEECLKALDRPLVFLPGNLEAAQRELQRGLNELLTDRPARDFVATHLLPTAARLLRKELVENDKAWREFYGGLLDTLQERLDTLQKRLDNPSEDARAEREKLEKVLEKLKKEGHVLVNDLRAAIEKQSDRSEAGVSFENRDVWSEQIVQTVGTVIKGDPPSNLNWNPPPCPPSNVIFRNERVSADNIYQTAGHFIEHKTPAIGGPAMVSRLLTLTLRFTLAAGKVRVHWHTDILDEFSSDLTVPYRGHELAAVLRALERLQHPTFALTESDRAHLRNQGLLDADGEPPADLPRRVGQTLYAALTNGQGRDALDLARRRAAGENRPLVLRLLLPPEAVKPASLPELAALPWELLWPPQEQRPLLLDTKLPLRLTRHLDLSRPLPARSSRSGRPLRILSLLPRVRCAPEDRVEMQIWLNGLWNELRKRDIAEVLEVSPVTRDELEDSMEKYRPDIVQFTGHSWYAEDLSALLFDPPAPGAPAERGEAGQAAAMLQEARIVVLAAWGRAPGAGVTSGGASLLTKAVSALSAAGASAVLGMQLSVGADEALRAIESFYTALANGHSAQDAVGKARTVLGAGEPKGCAWCAPVLYVCSGEEGPVEV